MTRVRIDRVKFAAELAKRDMTLAALSDIVGVSRQILSGVKAGKTCLLETGEKIAQGLNVQLSELLEGR